VVLALPGEGLPQLTIRHAAGNGAQQALGLEPPVEASLSGQVLTTGHPVTVEDFRHDERVARATPDDCSGRPDLCPAWRPTSPGLWREFDALVTDDGAVLHTT
jgi:hypothetical protein